VPKNHNQFMRAFGRTPELRGRRYHGDLPFHAWLDGVARSSPRRMCAFALGTTRCVSLSLMMDVCVTDFYVYDRRLQQCSPSYPILLIEARVMSPTTSTASLDGSSFVYDFQLFAALLPVAWPMIFRIQLFVSSMPILVFPLLLI